MLSLRLVVDFMVRDQLEKTIMQAHPNSFLVYRNQRVVCSFIQTSLRKSGIHVCLSIISVYCMQHT